MVKKFHGSFDCWLNVGLQASTIELECRLPKGQANSLILVEP